MDISPGSHPRWTLLADAAALAFHLHGTQLRKGTDIPYLAHLMAVSALVLEHGGDEEQAVAGLLHDVLEDCGSAHEETIAARYGSRVAAIVRGCTDADVIPKPPWRARKEAYLAHLENAGPDVLLVSACDKLHNACAIVQDLRVHGPSMMGRFNAGREGTLWYYRRLSDAFARLLPGRLAEELGRAVGEMERLAR